MTVLYIALGCLAQVWLVGPFVWLTQEARRG